MVIEDRKEIRNGVVEYLTGHDEPIRIKALVQAVRGRSNLPTMRDADVKSVILPMITTGTLEYTPELKVRLVK
jgi:hypothetical protein